MSHEWLAINSRLLSCSVTRVRARTLDYTRAFPMLDATVSVVEQRRLLRSGLHVTMTNTM